MKIWEYLTIKNRKAITVLKADELTEGSIAYDIKQSSDALKGVGYTEGSLKSHEDALTTLNASDTIEGSVLKSIKDNAENATFTPTVGSGIESMTIEEAVNEVGALGVSIGDRQDVVLENKITNGDFSDGTTKWAVQNSTISVSNNILSITGDGNDAQPKAYQLTKIALNSGDKIFVAGKLRVTNSDCETLIIRWYGNNVAGYVTTVGRNDSVLVNEWNTLYGVTEVTNQTGALRLQLEHFYDDKTTAIDKVIEVDGNYGVFALNLSDIFGKGLEPSADEMKALIDIIGYVDESYILTNLDMVNWMLSLIRENRTQIVALGGSF